jgi:hypothetical protein
LQLGSQPRLEEELAETRGKLDALLPGTREKLAEEKRQALTAEERQLLDLPREKLMPEQAEQRYKLEPELEVTDREVAERIAREQPENAKQALQLASDLERQEIRLRYTINYKRDANFDYWQTRADFEQTRNALDAREAMYNARKAFENADLLQAKRLYEEGFAKWRLVIDQFPSILDAEATTGDDLIEYIKHYRDVLDQLDETIGEDFPLWEVIEKFDREQNFVEELNVHRQRQTDEPGDPPPASPESSAASDQTP